METTSLLPDLLLRQSDTNRPVHTQYGQRATSCRTTLSPDTQSGGRGGAGAGGGVLEVGGGREVVGDTAGSPVEVEGTVVVGGGEVAPGSVER